MPEQGQAGKPHALQGKKNDDDIAKNTTHSRRDLTTLAT
jgi:hypothetical protein